jgi:hypothetical protein
MPEQGKIGGGTVLVIRAGQNWWGSNASHQNMTEMVMLQCLPSEQGMT